MSRYARKRVVIAGSAMVVVAAILGVLGLAATGSRAENPPPKTATPTAMPSPPPTPSPTPESIAPPAETPPAGKPFGPLAAEPFRVHTGDGDCLNVRPVPGTTFQSDPRTCVPEGFLLLLYGEPREADGHTWRYALGEGWVALEYVQPAPGAAAGFGPFSAVTVSTYNGETARLARVTDEGEVTPLPSIQAVLRGLGDVAPSLSPDGRWAAFGGEKGYVPTLIVRNIATGAEREYPQAYFASWSASNRLLVRVNTNCPQQCTWTVAWLDPAEGVLHPLTDKTNSWWTTAWAPDGESLYVVEDGALKQVWLDGRARVIVPKQPAGSEIAWGQLVLTSDGTKLLSSPFQGDIVVVDLVSGAVSRIPRARQIAVGGRCGGSVGVLTAWLDANTVIWHESFAEKGGNGITISRIDGSGRRLIPFFTVSDIRLAAPGLVSFATWENPENKDGFQLTWLLDTKTGEARPVTVGASPVWE